MIFLNNVFLTDVPLPMNVGCSLTYDRGLYEWGNKVDVYKYTLASMSKIYNWKKAIIYYELDEGFKDREDELVEFIKEEFKETELILRNRRNERQADWKETYKLLDDELVWFLCNHDHIYVDYQTEYFHRLISKFRQFGDKPYTLLFTHWPEALRLYAGNQLPRPCPSYEEEDDYISTDRLACDSIQIFTKRYYEDMWCKESFEEAYLPRSDYKEGVHTYAKIMNQKVFTPIRELVRHFDGYAHCHPPCRNEICPALRIPPGFFENDIKIRYGYVENVEGYVNIHPLKPHFTTDDPNGTDFAYGLDKLPLCWKNRISQVDINPDFDDSLVRRAELKRLSNMLTFAGPFTSSSLVDKILNQYGFAKKA